MFAWSRSFGSTSSPCLDSVPKNSRLEESYVWLVDVTYLAVSCSVSLDSKMTEAVLSVLACQRSLFRLYNSYPVICVKDRL